MRIASAASALVLLALNVLDTHTAHAAHRAGEVRVNELRRKAHGLEDLRGVVALHRGEMPILDMMETMPAVAALL